MGSYHAVLKTDLSAKAFTGWPATATLIEQQVDAGCTQDNFITINPGKAFANLRNFYQTRQERLSSEVQWLENHAIDLVVSDVPSLPLQAAKLFGVPSLLIANFTWHDIYAGLAGAAEQTELLDILKQEYAAATLHILPQCHIQPITDSPQQEVGFISKKGRDIRQQLELGGDLSNQTLVFIYLGDHDASSIHWQNLEKIEECLFITRDSLPTNVSNLFVLDDKFTYTDLIASSDIVLTKAGYSTLALAFNHGKPVLSCSREGFVEYAAIRNFLQERQVGLIIPPEKFFSGDWQESILQASQLKVAGKVKLEGATEVHNIIDNLLGVPTKTHST